MHDAPWKSALRRKLLKWFDQHQRDLPWRKNKTRYRIWVSEIMLQQTQVATVIDYFQRFTRQFPSVKKLAAANESEVLKRWEGLGYYRRARQMHAASQVIMREHRGRFPDEFDAVVALPGIGRYTAGAILSISMDQRLPILEGNTIRLFARLIEMKSDPRTTANQKVLWEFSQSLLPRKRCGDFNQALMELGSEICHPKRPQCSICLLRDLCPTHVKGLQEQIPVPARKVQYEDINEAVVVVKRGNRFLVRQCAPGDRWAGLWDFPRFAVQPGEGPVQLAEHLRAQTGLTADVERTGDQIKHVVTRFRIKLDCYFAKQVSGRLKKASTPVKWMTLAEINDAPMSVTGRKIARTLDPSGPA